MQPFLITQAHSWGGGGEVAVVGSSVSYAYQGIVKNRSLEGATGKVWTANKKKVPFCIIRPKAKTSVIPTLLSFCHIQLQNLAIKNP